MDDNSKTGDQNATLVEAAFATVMKTFESKLAGSESTDAHTAISKAIDAIRQARQAIGHLESASPVPPGAAKPGSEQEMEEELAKEKLDP